MKEIVTSRYKINVEEITDGGPAGYESTFISGLGEIPSDSLFSQLGMMGDHELAVVTSRALRGRNLESLEGHVNDEKKLAVVSGFKPSGSFHFGHMLTSNTVAYFQKAGLQIFVPVADLECRFDNKKDLNEWKYWAADNLLDWGAAGLNLDAAHVYLQSEEGRVGTLAYMLARELTFDKAADIYGMETLVNAFPFQFAGLTQVGDILLPQQNDFGNDHSFMLSGPDQDGHMQMTMYLARTSLNKEVDLSGIGTIPSALYIPHVRGFKPKSPGEEPKMSSSFSQGTFYLGPGPSYMTLSERIEDCESKVLSASDAEDPIGVCVNDIVTNITPFSHLFTENVDTLVQNFHDFLPELLTTHYERRREILVYAMRRTEGLDASAPSFWTVPESAIVSQTNPLDTQWYDLVAASSGRIKP